MTLKVKSTRFGELEIEEGKIINMPEGMIGFSEKRFGLLSPPNGPFHWLQSLDNPDLAFVVVDPKTCLPEYDVKLTADEYRKLGLSEGAEIAALAVVSMDRDPRNVTVNLLGPIIMNPDNMTALQIVLEAGKYTTRHPYFSNFQ